MNNPRYNRLDRRQPALAAALAGGAALLALAGCGGDGDVRFTIDEKDMGRISEELVEVPLGLYEVPVPVPYSDEKSRTRYRNAMLFRFRLDALVDPHESSSTKRLVARNESLLRDRVMTTCRNTSVAELLDPQLTAFRARVLDEIQPLFEGQLLRKLVITDVISDPL